MSRIFTSNVAPHPAIPLAVIMVTGIYTVPIDLRVLAGVGFFFFDQLP